MLERAGEAQILDLIRAHLRGVLAEDSNLARSLLKQPTDAIECSRLAASVGSDESDELTRSDLKRDILDSDEPAEFLSQILDFEYWFTHLNHLLRRPLQLLAGDQGGWEPLATDPSG